jgi:hypothetical protein
MTLTKQEIKFIANALPTTHPSERLRYAYVEPTETGCTIFSTNTHALHMLDIVFDEGEALLQSFYLDWRRVMRDAAYSSDKEVTVDFLEDSVQMHGTVKYYQSLQCIGEYAYLQLPGQPIDYRRVIPKDGITCLGGKTAIKTSLIAKASVLAGESGRLNIEQAAPTKPFLITGEGRWRAVIMPMSVN